MEGPRDQEYVEKDINQAAIPHGIKGSHVRAISIPPSVLGPVDVVEEDQPIPYELMGEKVDPDSLRETIMRNERESVLRAREQAEKAAVKEAAAQALAAEA